MNFECKKVPTYHNLGIDVNYLGLVFVNPSLPRTSLGGYTCCQCELPKFFLKYHSSDVMHSQYFINLFIGNTKFSPYWSPLRFCCTFMYLPSRFFTNSSSFSAILKLCPYCDHLNFTTHVP